MVSAPAVGLGKVEPMAQDIRSTTVFRKGNGHWQTAHPHTDRFG
jgi:hypothetical protein